MQDSKQLVPVELIANKTYLIRRQIIMPGRDLAALYGMPALRFNEAVKRNRKRFPGDFMLQVTAAEHTALTSHIPISNSSMLPQLATGSAVGFLF
jgi:hypothetical protein